MNIAVIGCGPGTRECLTLEAITEIDSAEVLIGTPRLLELVPSSSAKRIAVGGFREETLNAIGQHEGKRIAVLVTGDPGLASLASAVIEQYGIDRCRVIPGISSVQVAFARLGLSWEGARIISSHSATPVINIERLSEENTIAVLTGGADSLRWIARLARTLGENWKVVIAQDLTLPNERVFNASPAELESLTPPLRAVIIFDRKSKA